MNVPFYVGGVKRWKNGPRRVGGYWLCSDEDADLRERVWSLIDGYASESGSCGRVLAHRLIAERMLGLPLRADEEVHHRDGNVLNNQRENLQVMSKSEHRALTAREKPAKKSTLPIGVYWPETHKRPYSQITKGGVSRYLGTFDAIDEASAAYQKALAEEESTTES